MSVNSEHCEGPPEEVTEEANNNYQMQTPLINKAYCPVAKFVGR
jgi:hypothetical protein